MPWITLPDVAVAQKARVLLLGERLLQRRAHRLSRLLMRGDSGKIAAAAGILDYVEQLPLGPFSIAMFEERTDVGLLAILHHPGLGRTVIDVGELLRVAGRPAVRLHVPYI